MNRSTLGKCVRITSMDSDSKTSIDQLKRLLLDFRDERDWAQFHDPKNLAEAISIEAAELLELFLWKSPNDVANLLKADAKFRDAVEDELADILSFVLIFANATDIDVSRAVSNKIEKNRKKYPVEKAKGSATKYDQL
jgi:NTP pyrophosphatase (non-canonical NTP hydrolase)